MAAALVESANEDRIDKVLFEIAKDYRSNLMEPKSYQEQMKYILLFSPPFAPPTLPNVLTFITPKRYWRHIKYIEENNQIKSELCQQVGGVMEYLCTASIPNGDYASFYENSESGSDAQQIVETFFSKQNTSTFAMLLVITSLHQFTDEAKVHYFTVIKLGDKYRMVHSFSNKFSLSQELSNRGWMNKSEIQKIVNAFLFLHHVDEKSSSKDIMTNSKLALGVGLKLERTKSKWGKQHELQCVAMYDLSVDQFESAANHLLGFMKLCLKIDPDDVNKMGHDIPLCFRIGYPQCLDTEKLREMNVKNGWGYKVTHNES